MTFKNICNLFCSKKKKERLTDFVTIILGLIYSLALISIPLNISKPNKADYNDAIYTYQLHNPFHSEYGITIALILFLAYAGLMILCYFNPEKLSPLISAISTAMTIIGIIVAAFVFVQLSYNFTVIHLMLYLYYFNIIIIAARRIKFHISEQVRLINERQTVFRHKFTYNLYSLMSTISKMTSFSFLMIFPIAAILEIIFIILGQGPDGVIKAFTMTADWTFSTQTPPPPIEYEGHYLCTVAAGGHKKMVKPIRLGKRLGKTIVVNRQLLTANAFEDLIIEKCLSFIK